MFSRKLNIKAGEFNDGHRHAEFQSRNTRVSEYLRKYGQGKLDEMPTDGRPEVKDDRSVDQMLDDDVEHFGTDPVEVLAKLQEALPKFEAAKDAIAQNEKDRQAFDDAVRVIRDPNESVETKRRAYEVLYELREAGKVKNARARD